MCACVCLCVCGCVCGCVCVCVGVGGCGGEWGGLQSSTSLHPQQNGKPDAFGA